MGGGAAELWNDEVELLAEGLLRLAVRRLFLARSPQAELEAWQTIECDLSLQLIELLGCDAEVILFQVRLEHERRKSGRGK